MFEMAPFVTINSTTTHSHVDITGLWLQSWFEAELGEQVHSFIFCPFHLAN